MWQLLPEQSHHFSMKLVADESVDFRIVTALRSEGYEIWAIAEEDPSITDIKVLDIAFEQSALLLTEDKDFGELVIRLRLPHHGVFLIRLGGFQINLKIGLVIRAIHDNYPKLVNNFAVLDGRRLRIRPIK